MFSLVKNYKKLFLMCVRNEFEGDIGGRDFSGDIQKLQELAQNGIEENKQEFQNVKQILENIFNYSKNSGKIAEEQFKEIMDFLDNQISNLNHKKQSSEVLMDNSFSEYNSETLAFLNNSKTQFKNLKEKFFSDKNEIVGKTKRDTNETKAEIKEVIIDFSYYIDKDKTEEALRYLKSNDINDKKTDLDIGEYSYILNGKKITKDIELKKFLGDIYVELDETRFFDDIDLKLEGNKDLKEVEEKVQKLVDKFMKGKKYGKTEKFTDKQLYPELYAEEEKKVSVEVKERGSEEKENYGFIIEKDGSVILPDGIEPSEENNVFVNPKTQEKYKLEDGKVIKIGGEEKKVEAEKVTPIEKVDVEVAENKSEKKTSSGEKTSSNSESREKVNSDLEKIKNFYKRVGATKENIKEIQEKLKEVLLNPGTIDGIIGPNTIVAIKEYQKKKGLTPDGMVGNRTLKKLILEDMTVDKFYGVKEEIIRNDNSEYYTWKNEEKIGTQQEEKSKGGGR